MEKKPNVIIFNPDQMRADAMRHLGCDAAYTPNFDALAKEGVSFSNAFCQNPVCVPSRCSFMTGLYPHTNGHRTMAHLLRPHEDNLFLDMKDAGYYTVSSTRGDLLAGQYSRYQKKCVDEFLSVKARKGHKAVNYSSPKGDDFYTFYDGIIPTDSPDEVAVNLDDLTVDAAVRFIKRRPKNKPFFMFLALNFPHPPYQIEQKYYDLIDKSKLPTRLPNIDDGKPSMEQGLLRELKVTEQSEERLKDIRAVYLAMCAKVDDMLGRLTDALKEEGLYDDTALLCFSDHGDYTTDYGLVEKAQNCFPDCLVNIPLLIKPQKGVAVDAGVNDNLAELTDICSTVHALTNVSPTRVQFGVSLLPAMADKSKALHDCVFCEGGRLIGEEHASEADGYVEGDRYCPRLLLQGKMPEHTKAVMARSKQYKYVKRLYEKDEFYDLSLGENKNLIDDEKYKDEVQNLKNEMLNWYEATCDEVPQTLDDRFTADFICNLIRARGFPKFVGGLFKFYLKISGQSAGTFVKKIRRRFKV